MRFLKYIEVIITFLKYIIGLLFFAAIAYLMYLVSISEFEFNGEKIVAIITTLTSTGSLMGLAFALMQLSEMQKQRNLQLKQVEQELQELTITKLSKGLEKVEEFRLIMKECSFIIDVFQTDRRYVELIREKKLTDLKLFRMTEMKRLFTLESDREFLTNLYSFINNNFVSIANLYQNQNFCDDSSYDLISHYNQFSWDEKRLLKEFYNVTDYKGTTDIRQYGSRLNEKYKSSADKDEKDELVKKIKIYNDFATDANKMRKIKKRIRNNIIEMIDNVQSKLEAWSMAFNVGLAQDDIVYQSLNQAYLFTISYFYPLICKVNDNEIHGQYYTNIIELFNKWVNVNEIHKSNLEKLESSFFEKSRKI